MRGWSNLVASLSIFISSISLGRVRSISTYFRSTDVTIDHSISSKQPSFHFFPPLPLSPTFLRKGAGQNSLLTRVYVLDEGDPGDAGATDRVVNAVARPRRTGVGQNTEDASNGAIRSACGGNADVEYSPWRWRQAALRRSSCPSPRRSIRGSSCPFPMTSTTSGYQ
jgi:hypothetical protein